MSKFLPKLTLALTLAGCVLFNRSPAEPAAASPPPAGIEGTWMGTLSVSGMDLRIVFHIAKTDAGWAATIDSPDQGAKGIPVSQVDWSGGKLLLEIKPIGGSFSGSLSADGSRLDGMWAQGMGTLPLTLKRVDRVAMPARPQTPQRPYPYAEETVTFPSLARGATLAGTLTFPKTPGPHAAVVLVSGSGPNGRDELVAGHRIFLVLSDYLTRRGFAVLRYDKRGVGKSTGSYATATTADFADDAEAAVEYLHGRAGIAPGHIGILGHSEGGQIAPMVAARCKDAAFIVLIGAPGVPGDQILIEQLEAIGRADGLSEEKLALRRAAAEQLYALIIKEADLVKLEADLNASVESQIAAAGSEQEAFGSAGAGKKMVKLLMTPWFRYFIAYDPKPTLEKVICPVLAVGGELDLQVPAGKNLPVIQSAFKAGGNTDFTVKELPGLNHLLQEAKTGSPREYSKIEQTMSPAALRLIGDWIAARTANGRT